MILNKEIYRDKVYACWIGKNIGGTMGTPYEGSRLINDIKGFATKEGEILPNDDLDLQLVWLYAMEQCGPNAVSAAMLGEHWLSLVTPHWNEYGLGKANMKRGLPPPLAGDFDNDWKNSNGAWIRTEIWASTAPGLPGVAACNAMEDAMVDHGAGEGTFAAAFVAAMQSAAFAISDLRACIEVGLCAIPEDCRVYKSIRFLLDCYEKKMDWKDARNAVQQLNADIGDGWFEAPSNVAYTVLGLLWGEGDFKKSMITAINCGDDTDCTGATVGSTLGILYGTKGIPEDWKKHIGDGIVTVSIAKGNNGKFVPKTCAELTERVVAITPSVLYAGAQRFAKDPIRNVVKPLSEILPEGILSLGEKNELPENTAEVLKRLALQAREKGEALVPYSMRFENVTLEAQLSLSGEPVIAPEAELSVRVALQAKISLEDEPRNLKLRWILPEGWKASGKRSVMLHGFDPHSTGKGAMDFVITAGECVEAENRVVLEISEVGRFAPLYCSFVILG